MKCPVCNGSVDSEWTCIRCGEVCDEPMERIKKMMRSREDEADKKRDN